MGAPVVPVEVATMVVALYAGLPDGWAKPDDAVVGISA
jgi:hypothetical protein